MTRDRIVDFVGASDEELAHLRLLMRKAAKSLVERWRLRVEPGEKLDLMLVDPSNVVGSTALARAKDSGLRCVLVSDQADVHDAEHEVLSRPFKVDAIVRMLNRAGMEAMTAAVLPPAMPKITHNVFDDIFAGPAESAAQEPAAPNFDFDIPAARFSPRARFEEAEAIYKHDADREHREALKKISLGDHIEIEATEGLTLRAGNVKDRGIRVSSAPPLSPQYDKDDAVAGEGERHRMDAYLTRSLLAGPSRLTLGNLAPLVLDPRNKLFYSKGSLCVFEAHCVRQIPTSAWKRLSVEEFAEVREQYSARDYAELHWLTVYMNSGGRLAQHMDPTAMYRLRKPFQLGRDYPQASRIVDQMQRAARPADLATSTRCDIAEVYNVLNAFDAIGYLDRA